MSDSLRPHGLQHTRLPCPSLSPRVCSNSYPSSWLMPSNHLVLCHPFLLLPSISPSISLFQWVGTLHQVTTLLELKHQSFQWIFRVDFLWDWLVWSPCCPRDSQESSPAPQFKSINSSVLSLLYGLALTSIHDYWKNHSFDCTDFCLQSNISVF